MARLAYCVGCDTEFIKMHHMINHRRTKRCGGRFLPPDQRAQINARKMAAQYETISLREREALAQGEIARNNKVNALTRRIRAQRELAERVLRSRRARKRKLSNRTL